MNNAPANNPFPATPIPFLNPFFISVIPLAILPIIVPRSLFILYCSFSISSLPDALIFPSLATFFRKLSAFWSLSNDFFIKPLVSVATPPCSVIPFDICSNKVFDILIPTAPFREGSDSFLFNCNSFILFSFANF